MAVNRSVISSMLPPVQGIRKTVVRSHSVPDIIDEVMTAHKLYPQDYDRISEKFWKGNAADTAKCIWNFLKNNIQYRIESERVQTSKSPSVLLHHGYGDCKHYAGFINGVLSSLARKGYPIGNVLFRFSGYDGTAPDAVHHVFAVLQNGGREYWIDPVLPTFDNRKPYITHIDKNALHMPVVRLSGTYIDNNVGAPKFIEKIKNAVNTNAANLAKAAQKAKENVQKGAQNTVKKVVPTVAKVSLVTARNSFLFLVKVNGFNIAHRLYDFIKQSHAQAQELAKKWQSMGGNYDTLVNNINEGMRHYLKRNNQSLEAYNKERGYVGTPYINNSIGAYSDSYSFPNCINGISDGKYIRNVIGVEPASTAALLTAAAAVIAALAPLLKRAKWSDQDKNAASLTLAAGNAAIENAAANTPDGGTFPVAPAVLPNGTQTPLLNASVETMADGTKVVTVEDNGNINAQTGGSTITESIKNFGNSVTAFIQDNKTPIGFGAAALIAYYAYNKIKKPSTGRKK